MSTLLIILAAFGCVVIYFLVQAAFMMWRLNHLPPPPPRLCPRCSGTEYDQGVAGVWDGIRDPKTGKRPHGTMFYGTCKQCGTRVAQWDDDPPYVPSDDEWRREALFEKSPAPEGGE